MCFRVSIIFSAIFLFFSCNTRDKNEKKIPAHGGGVGKKINHTLAILPFKGVDSVLVDDLRNGLQKQLSVQITILDDVVLPSNAFYKPRQRYIADSLLGFLRQLNRGKFEKIIGVTTRDISTKKDPHENWGILGLGSCPGETCVISTFRAGKNKVSPKDFIRRMLNLALHELGHTYGLEHCPVANCIMKDAEGKMNLDDGDVYCKKCRNYLTGMGLMK
jgi:archaemetzincin